jgi:hypothetical protein
MKLVKEIKECSRRQDDWRGWAWLAERMFPSEFSKPKERDLPTTEDTEKRIPFKMLLNTGGKTLEELLDFPDIKPATPELPPGNAEDDDDPLR